VAKRQAGHQLVVSDGCYHGLSLGYQVHDACVDLIETLAQFEKFGGR
jgi:hypothetical protein